MMTGIESGTEMWICLKRDCLAVHEGMERERGKDGKTYDCNKTVTLLPEALEHHTVWALNTIQYGLLISPDG